jgi:hypothetical protein
LKNQRRFISDDNTRVTRKKATITLALNDGFLEAIKKDAEHEGISINAKLNSILQRYALCYRNFEKDEVMIIPSKTAQLILDHVEEQKLLEYCRSIVQNSTSSKSIHNNTTTITLQNWLKNFCNGLMPYTGMIERFTNYLDNDGHLCLSYTHEYGLKWSRILGTVLSEFIGAELNYHTTCSILPSNVVIKILERNVEGI